MTPPPHVGKLESGKPPPWCKGYEPSASDSNRSWVKSYMERDGWSYKTMEYVAKASGDKQHDAERQAMVAEWATDYKAAFAATDNDFVEAMTFWMMPQDARSKLEDEQCASYNDKDEAASAEQRTLTAAEGWVVGCGRPPDENLLYWLDEPQITEVHRVALLHRCIPNDPGGKDEKFRGAFAFCMIDMKSLDRGKFNRQLAGMNLNFYGKVLATLNFGIAKARAQTLLEKYAAKAKKDEEWRRLFDAPEQGWKAWIATFEANKPAFQAVRDFEMKAATGSKKALANCGAGLRTLWFEHMNAQKANLKSLEDAQNLATDVVGYPLLVALMRCDAAEARYLLAAAAQDLFMKRAKEHRGPRYAAYDTTMGVLDEIRADRAKFPLERMYPQPPGMGRHTWYKAYEETFNKISYDRGTGQIKDIENKGELAQVTFKAVKWKEQEAHSCKSTRRVHRIRDDGTLEYEQKCKYKTVQRSSTMEPVSIPVEFANGLEPGLMVDLMIDRRKDGLRVAIPKGVYKDPDKKKFVGTFGVVW